MLLSCYKLSKAFGTDVIVADASFHIEEREHVALVGPNGAGKSTLLKMITGELESDSGTITLAKGKTIGYLAQQHDFHSENTIYEEVKKAKSEVVRLEAEIRAVTRELDTLSGDELQHRLNTFHQLTSRFEQMNGYALESEVTGVLKGLGFDEDDFDRKISTLSGGQQTRVALGRILLSDPDLLLLDEPTNHLDLHSVAWLETYLQNYNGAVLIVSHDRYFLNRVAVKVLDLDQGTIQVYAGNYDAYARKRSEVRHARIREYLKQQQEIKHQEAVIEKLRSFNREKSIKRAESREKMLAKIDRVEKPAEVNTRMGLTLTPAVASGNDVLNVEHLSKSFGPVHLFSDVSFEVRRGEHVSVIGDNGTGKTTLLKILNGVEPADGGSFTLGSNVTIGYYDQEYHVLDDSNNIFDEISDTYPDLTDTEIRNMLAAFLFTGDDVFKQIGTLSGGEKGRVSLAKLMLSNANFLILDQPTNHLDIDSKEILEEALNNYEGTVLYVSHDRYFINQTATRILELKNQHFINYIGNYDYYLEKVDILSQPAGSEETGPAETDSGKDDWQKQKELKAREQKRRSDLKKCEDEIEQLEARVQELDDLMLLEENYTDPGKCRELAGEKSTSEERLSVLYEQWEELAADDE